MLQICRDLAQNTPHNFCIASQAGQMDMFLFNLLPKHSSHGHRSSQLGLPHELPGYPIPQLADLHCLHHRLASVDDGQKSVLHTIKEDLAVLVVMKLQASKYQFTLQPIRSHGKKHQMTQVLLNLRALEPVVKISITLEYTTKGFSSPNKF